MAIVVPLLSVSTAFAFGEAHTENFVIAGVERQAIVFANTKPVGNEGAPVVFVFMDTAATLRMPREGFASTNCGPKPSSSTCRESPAYKGITDPEGTRNGWQKNPGELGDRDLKFFDAALELAQKKYKADPNRVYVLGHSNGGRFVNLLWNMRGDKIAALCSAAGPGGRLIESSKPKPVFIIAGEKDPLVPFQTQQNSIEFARKLLKADPSKAKVEGLMRTEPGVSGTELVTYIHPGGHQFPTEALPSVISFFKRHTR